MIVAKVTDSIAFELYLPTPGSFDKEFTLFKKLSGAGPTMALRWHLPLDHQKK